MTTTLDAAADYVVIINIFSVDPAKAEELVRAFAAKPPTRSNS